MRWPAGCMLLGGRILQVSKGVLRACLLVRSCQLLQLHLQAAHLGLRHHKSALRLSNLPLPPLADRLLIASPASQQQPKVQFLRKDQSEAAAYCQQVWHQPYSDM